MFSSPLRVWKQNFVRHITYIPEDIGCAIIFKKDGQCHNEGFPALIHFHNFRNKPENIKIYELVYYYKNKLHRPIEDGPALIKYDYDSNKVLYVSYYVYGKLHRVTDEGIFKPAVIKYHYNGTISSEEYYIRDIKHRPDGPAHVGYDELGNVIEEKYYMNGKIHRSKNQGPAVIYYDKNYHRINKKSILSETYYKYNEIHNDFGPARITYHSNGNIATVEYYLGGMKHRIGEPAVTKYNELGKKKREVYYIHNMKHRVDEPAIIDYYPNGNVKKEVYYIQSDNTYDKIGRYSLPGVVEYYTNGKLKKEIYYMDGKIHRYYGPAKIWYDRYGNQICQRHYNFGKKI